MKKVVLTMLAIMVGTHATHTISNGAIVALTFIPIAIVTGVIVHKNNVYKRKHVREMKEKELLIADLKKRKNEKKDQKLQLRRLESHNKKDSAEAIENRSEIQDLTLKIEDLEDRIESLT